MKLLKQYHNLFVVMVFNLIVALQFLTGCNNKPGVAKESKVDQAVAVQPPKEEVEDMAYKPGMVFSADSLQKLLKGRWLRSDGTYIIEIFSIKADGIMDAGYFNPNPINVGKSGWSVREGEIVFEIILKDINYPGSKYNLIYDKLNNSLSGNYFQAVQGINYDVVFLRQK